MATLLKGVLLVGPRIQISNHIKLLYAALPGYRIIGDGINPIGAAEMQTALKGTYAKAGYTRIDIAAHGDFKEGRFEITLPNGSRNLQDVLSLIDETLHYTTPKPATGYPQHDG